MTNPFEAHGVKNLSASQINAFIDQPALWVMEKLFKMRGPTTPMMVRGSSVEAGLEHLLRNPDAPFEEGLRLTHKYFDKEMALNTHHKRQTERDNLEPMLRLALEQMRPLGIPDEQFDIAPSGDKQKKIEIYLDGIEVPIIGYLDFVYSDRGLCVDLKTTGAMKSTLDANYSRQGAIYAHALGNHKIDFCVVTPKKVEFKTLEDPGYWLHEVHHAAMRLRNFLSASPKKEALASIVMPNFSHFKWSDANTRALGRELFGW